jgi:hypothetical protein
VIDGLVLKKDTQMNRRVFIALAVAAMAFSTSTASAGGGGSNTQYVRIKNIGAKSVNVVAVNGSPSFNDFSTIPGTRALSQNRVTQFVLKKGVGSFIVLNAAKTDGDNLSYNFPNSTYVYLQAKDDGNEVTASFAPPGTRF